MIKLIYGCMYSQKSTTALNWLRKELVKKKKVAYVKIYWEKIDNIETHDQEKALNPILISKDISFDDFLKIFHSHDSLVIDEIQFLPTETMSKIIFTCLYNTKKRVCFVGLATDSTSGVFNNTAFCACYADNVTKKSAICTFCGKRAHFNKKIKGNFNEILEQDGKAEYLATCWKCFRKDDLK